MMEARNFAVVFFCTHNTLAASCRQELFFHSFNHNWNKQGTEFVRKREGQHLPKAEFFHLVTQASNILPSLKWL